MTTRKNKELVITDFSQINGVGPETVKKLINNGDYLTITEIAASIPEELATKCKMTPASAVEVVQGANELLIENGFLHNKLRSGSEDLVRRKEVIKIPTGSKTLDFILQGGIESNSITEFFALNGGGKTQICHTVSMNAAKIGLKVLYIDCEGAFRSNRIEQMCLANGLNPKEILDNITVASMEYKAELIVFIDKVLPKLIEERKFKLVIVDSIIALFRAEYGGMGELATKMQKIGSIMHKLSRLSDIFNVATIVTNQMQDNVGSMYGPSKIPTGGNTLGHASTYRIALGKKEGYRTAEVYKSPQSGNLKVSFHVDNRGVVDTPNVDKELEKLTKESEVVSELTV